MKVGVVGTRGIPNNYGGFERFIEILVQSDEFKRDFEFVIYGSMNTEFNFSENVKVKYAGCDKGRRPLTFYALSLFRAARECDIILCCGAGGSLFSVLPRLMGKKIMTNIDGLEWRRSKWSIFSRLLLWFLYQPTFLFSNVIVADAKALVKYIPNLYQKKVKVIEYQAPMFRPEILRDLAQWPKDFALCVCRLEPENNVEMIIKGHLLSKTKIPLYIVGNKTTKYYVDSLQKYDNDVVFLGGIYDLPRLDMLRTSCKIYYHGHSVGGTNPSLLEAMVYVPGILLCHDNEFNREVTSELAIYFSSEICIAEIVQNIDIQSSVQFPLGQYDQNRIAKLYKELFKDKYDA